MCLSHPRQLADTNLELLKFLVKSLRNFDIIVLTDNKQKATIHYKHGGRENTLGKWGTVTQGIKLLFKIQRTLGFGCVLKVIKQLAVSL